MVGMSNGVTKAKRTVKVKKIIEPVDVDESEQNGDDDEPTPSYVRREMMQNTDYKSISQHELVLKRPNLYIGSIRPSERIEWMLDTSDPDHLKMVESSTTIPPALCHLFTEILDNASDACNTLRECKNGIGRIDVEMDDKTIVLTSIGCGMLVEESVTSPGVLIPTMSFGVLNTSTNYDDGDDTKDNKLKRGRTGVGANGLGSKAVNIWSSYFMIEIGDPVNNLLFQQTWRDNMYTVEDHVVEAYNEDVAYVKTTFQADFARMGMTCYPTETQALFARRLLDTAFAAGVPCSFNGQEFSLMSLFDYASLYFDDKIAETKAIIHYEYPLGTPCVLTTIRGQKVQIARDSSVLPTSQIVVFDTPNMAKHISFVNTIYMKEGGIHVKTIYKAISDYVIGKVDHDSLSVKTQAKLKVGVAKGKENVSVAKLKAEEDEKSAAKTKALKLTVKDVKKHTSIFIVCHVRNPVWVGATKTKLASCDPAFTVRFKETELEKLLKWDLVSMLNIEKKNKSKLALVKTDGSKQGVVLLPNYERANLEGGPHSKECTVWLSEGLSAAAYIGYLIDKMDKGWDYNGVMPLRGVPPNVMSCSDEQLMKPLGVLAALKKIIGIKENVDYSKDKSQLRYGRIVVCADADLDGMHILGLVLLIFFHLYPSLVSMVQFLRTPINLVTRKSTKELLKFYTEEAFEKWASSVRAKNELDKYSIRYLKGLGSSEKEDAWLEMPDLRLVAFKDDRPKSHEMMNLAFNTTLADERKEWISQPTKVKDFSDVSSIKISDFIDMEMIKFSRDSLARMLPTWDGLKRVQQKIVFGCFSKFGRQCGNQATPYLIDRLSSHCQEVSFYKNGQASIAGAITHMCFDFVGSNNLPLIYGKGGKGTRKRLGADAASPRYLSAFPQWSWKYLFDKKDEAILTHVFEEGHNTQPEVYFPIVPLVLINGCTSIATGWSSFIPNHNPLDVIDWLIAKITESPLPTLNPWYRGFTGTIEIKKSGSKSGSSVTTTVPDPVPLFDENGNHIDGDDAGMNVDDDDDNLFENDSDNESSVKEESTPEKPIRMSMVTEGVWRRTAKGVRITELPIGTSTLAYASWLDLQQSKHLIKTYNRHDTTDTIDFEIIAPTFEPNTLSLKLRKTYGLSNMVTLDVDGRPIRFKDTLDLIEQWYDWRLPYYEKRKESMIAEIDTDIKFIESKMNFINLVVTGVIEVRNQSKDNVHAQMVENNLDPSLFDKMKLSDLTSEEPSRLQSQLDKLVEKRNEIEQVDSRQMWLDDLSAFRTALVKHYSTKEEKVTKAKKNSK